MKKIILVGLVPPPFNGQSVAFGLLIDKMKALNMPIKVVDMSFGGEMDKGGRSSFHRMLDFVKVFWDLVRYAIGGNFVLYLQIAQSRRGFMRDMVMNRIAGFFGGKTVVHLHGGNYGVFYKEQPENIQRMINKELDSYSSIIILSDSLRDMFSFHQGLEGKLVSLPNGIGAAVGPVKPKLLPEKGTPVKLLYLSNMIESKGYMRVLEAVHILNRKGFQVESSFCGTFLSEDGGNDDNLENKEAEFFDKIRQYNLNETVKFLGVVVGSEKERLLQESHFFLLPTNYHNEGQPISIIEAMRYGCVVVSSDYRAIPDMVEDGKTGYLVDSVLPDTVASKIEECLSSDPQVFSDMSRSAILRYNEHFTAEAHTRALISLLERLAQKK